MHPHPSQETIDAVRAFNRFYTRRIGVLNEGLLRSPYSLTEARVLFELSRRSEATASDLSADLNADTGYMSRVVTRLEEKGLLKRMRASEDGRRRLLCLTARGRSVFETLDKSSREEVRAMLAVKSAEDCRRLCGAMRSIESILDDTARPSDTPYVLRQHGPGDIGWIVYRHGVLYSDEYRFDETFEALVADILARFVASYDPKRERIWIAELDGKRVGSVVIAKDGEDVAQLRLFLVEPEARGHGIGTRLVDECIRFSRTAGYGKISLWTQSVLDAARRIYIRAGFRLVREEPHRSFGHDLVAETWELEL